MRTPKQVYAENVSFEEHNEQTKDRRIKQFKWAAISGWSVALLSALSVSPLLQLQHIIATAIVVDRGTGDYKIERDSMVVVSPGSPDFNQRAVSDLGRFVKA
ncbi:hypothetical protein, partial [Burkholderia contaminans]